MKGFALLMVLGAVACAGAQVFDLKADFSTSSNPSGAWSYGRASSYSTSTGVSGFTLGVATSLFSGKYSGWAASGDNVSQNGTVSLANAGAGVSGVNTGDIILHPGAPPGSFTYAVVRWTAPSAGTITSIVGQFNAADISGTVESAVYGVGLQRFYNSNMTANSPFNISSSIGVTAGQTVDFVVGTGIDHNNAGDSTPTMATINFTPVPEPGTIAALSLGALALIRRRKRS